MAMCPCPRREDSRARVTAVTKYRNRILLTLASADNHRSPENHQFMSTLSVKGAHLRKSSVLVMFSLRTFIYKISIRLPTQLYNNGLYIFQTRKDKLDTRI